MLFRAYTAQSQELALTTHNTAHQCGFPSKTVAGSYKSGSLATNRRPRELLLMRRTTWKEIAASSGPQGVLSVPEVYHPVSHIVFWLNELSVHLCAWVRALAAVEGIRATVVAEREILPERQALGHSVPDLGRSAMTVCHDLASVSGLVRDMERGALHIVGGMRGSPLAQRALCELARRRARIGIISEAADGASWRGFLRRCIYRWEWARFAAAVDFVLAMGSYGVDWFAQCGCPR